MKKKIHVLEHLAEGPLKQWDYVIFLLIAGFCFLSFQQGDLLHTAGCSYGYLNGHILDFYDYDASLGIHPSYMPSIYILFAIWNIPMRLFGIIRVPDENLRFAAIMWAKLLPCLIYLLSGVVIYKICMEIGMGSKKSKICTYASLTMPIAVYAQFIFGQYDIFMLFCMLMGVYYYLRDEEMKFVLWFALSVTFKYSSLLLFFPLLLLKQKDIWKIIRACIIVLLPYVLEFILYYPSETFRAYAFGIGSAGDNPTGYVFNAALFTGFGLSGHEYPVYLTIVVFGIICALGYFTRPGTKEDLSKWCFYLSCLSFFVLFGLCKWHPQWLLMAVPFWVISAFMNRETKIFLVIDIIFMLLYTMFNVIMIPENVDQAMLNNGIFKWLFHGDLGTEVTMAELMGVLEPDLLLSMLTMIMLVYALFKHPKYCRSDMRTGADDCMGWIRARLIGGVAVFVVPAFICMAAYFTAPYATFQTDNIHGFVTELQEAREISQVFCSEGTTVDKIQYQIAINGQNNAEDLRISLRDYETGEILYTEVDNTSGWRELEIKNVKTGGISVEKGRYYEVVFQLENPSPSNTLNLLYSYDGQENKQEYACVDGKKRGYNIRMNIYQGNK